MPRRAPRLLCISGPNLQLLGTREPHVYGTTTLAQIHDALAARAASHGFAIDCRQSNHEGQLVDWIGAAPARYVGGLLNAAAYTHTSIALLDALKAVDVPFVEVHLSNPAAREPFRRRSRIAAGCVATVSGFGAHSYLLALDGLVARLARTPV